MTGCDCWTNSRGDWVLGPECSRRELDQWRDAMTRWSAASLPLGTQPQRKTAFMTVDGKLRMIDYYS